MKSLNSSANKCKSLGFPAIYVTTGKLFITVQQTYINCERNERVKIMIDSCTSKMDRIEAGVNEKYSATRPWEGWKHAVSKFKRE